MGTQAQERNDASVGGRYQDRTDDVRALQLVEEREDEAIAILTLIRRHHAEYKRALARTDEEVLVMLTRKPRNPSHEPVGGAQVLTNQRKWYSCHDQPVPAARRLSR